MYIFLRPLAAIILDGVYILPSSPLRLRLRLNILISGDGRTTDGGRSSRTSTRW